jgi:hypothetical protein
VHEASAQHPGGVSLDAIKIARTARITPAARTPGRKAGCRNFEARPERYAERRIALQAPSDRAGIQRVNSEVMALAYYRLDEEGWVERG